MARLSKSRFVSGSQCHKQLWWRVHESDASELAPDPSQQAIFDQGHLVGARAREQFPGGVLIDGHHGDLAGRVARTQAVLAAGAPAIFEASFFVDDIFVAVDVLERVGPAWTIVEVKSTTSVKAQHLPDGAIQAHVLRRSGLAVEHVEIMHLNRECRFPDLRQLFVRADVTGEVQAMLPAVAREASAQLRMLDGPMPEVAVGPHCETPYACPFRERCWPEMPEHHVSTLYGMGKRVAAFEAQGLMTIHDLPDGLGLSLPAERQRLAVQQNRVVVEASLGDALGAIAYPCAVLDFETVGLAIPVWDGCRPYDQVPVQFSCHVVDEQHHVTHHAWLADDARDPRPEMAARVVEACRGAAVVVAYNATFEKTVLRQLAAAVPELAEALADVDARMVDALPLVRNHIYHPDFGGSFSLKAVLPALVPGMGYEGLAIASGGLASQALQRLLFDAHMPPAERAEMREALLQYCAVDTLGVVRILEQLQGYGA